MLGFVRKWLGAEPPATPASTLDVDFRLLAENSNDVIIRCSMNGAVAQYVSPSSIAIFGRTPEEMIGRSHLEFVFPDDLAALLAVRDRHSSGDGSGLATFRVVKKDGSIVWVEGSGRTITDPASGLAELVIVIRDVSERKALEDKLAALARTDGLTGLANRRAFDEALEDEWRRTKRSGTKLSLLLLDVDRFKAFNDQHGHQVGDDCLRAVASTVSRSVRRAGDIAARYGGEEIAVILPETDSASAVTIAEAIRRAVGELRIPHPGNPDGDFNVSVSIGAATALSRVGGSVQMPSGLLQAADMALYKAKHNGRNRVETALLLAADGSNGGSDTTSSR